MVDSVLVKDNILREREKRVATNIRKTRYTTHTDPQPPQEERNKTMASPPFVHFGGKKKEEKEVEES